MLKRKLADIDKTANQIGDERTREIQNADKINEKLRKSFGRNLEAVKKENERYRKKVTVDPFMRRKTQPLMGDTQKCLDAMDNKYKTDIDMSYEQKTFIAKEDKAKAEEDEKRKKMFNLNSGDQKLENAHNFDLGIDDLFADSGPSKFVEPVKPVEKKIGGRINLAEWKKKKGLI